jgi:acetyl esterase/lipase
MLRLSTPDALPDGLNPERISFAVPRREFLDVQFAQHDGVESRYLSYDVYAPVEGAEHPVVMWVHGGGFVGGDKQHPLLATMKPDFFLSRGFVFVSVNYRLAPQYKFPAQGHDMAAALAHLHEHAGNFGGDPKQIFLIGGDLGLDQCQ